MRHLAPMQIRAACATEAQTDAGTSVVVFEAPNLPALASDVAAWVGTHPQYSLLSLSHACETRLEDRASLGGPAHIPVYTGLLLVVGIAPHEPDTPAGWSLPRDLVASGR